LLGVNGIVVICHGSSNARAIYNGILVAYEMAANEVIKKIHDEIITNHFGQKNEQENKSQDSRDRVVRPAPSDD
jgi:glycerol-3-phosphate acyltransferase PlsX